MLTDSQMYLVVIADGILWHECMQSFTVAAVSYNYAFYCLILVTDLIVCCIVRIVGWWQSW